MAYSQTPPCRCSGSPKPVPLCQGDRFRAVICYCRRMTKDTAHPIASIWGSLALSGVIIAFASQPLFRFANPSTLMGGALVIGLGLCLFHIASAEPNRFARNFNLALCFFLVIFGGFFLFMTQEEARDASYANDTRCLAIQRDMLSARHRMDDGPEIFQALGCRPQGTDETIRVKPTHSELRAGRPLPNGGYSRH